MCLILFAYNVHPDYRLMVAANRDEFYDRPTRPLARWDDRPAILAGRDLKSHGTWMGVTRTGRFAAITNYRDSADVKESAPSRGLLVSNFLETEQPSYDYLADIQRTAQAFNGFNLLTADGSDLCYYSNRGHAVERLGAGIYGLSNHLLDTPWPKVQKGKTDLAPLFTGQTRLDIEAIFRVLGNRTVPADAHLPHTGVGMEWERRLAPLFIQTPIYGTRSSSVVLMGRDGRITFLERTYPPHATEVTHQEFTFSVPPAPPRSS